MTTHNLTITPDRYFKPGISLNEANIKTFRDLYRRLSKVNKFDGHDVDKTSLLKAAQQLGIQADLDDHQEKLQECVKYEDDEKTFSCVDIRIQGSVQQLSLGLHSIRPSASESSKEDKVPTILTEVKCVLIIKRQGKDMNDFLHTFLLQIVKKDSIYKSSSDDTCSPCDNKRFLLHPGSLLALFIHEQMSLLGTIRQRSAERLRFAEPLSITDEFGTWSYDHFRGLFEIELRSHLQKSFPSCWVLANDARIHCQFVFSGTRQANEIASSFIFERPRTGSLELFVEDVCAKEDNMKAKQWLEALCAEDIFSFPHLSNLKQTEWDNIKRLSMNAKRILKAAVDRERENAADDRRRSFEESSPDGELPRSAGNYIDTADKYIRLSFLGNLPRESRSELLANLHLIKLFIYHTLRFERALQKYGALSKLEPVCIDASFTEMRDEGFADDGLFSTMGEFFLPLTISEQELRLTRSNVSSQVRQDQLNDHINEVRRLEKLLNEATMHRWDIDEKITDLNRTIEQAYVLYLNERLQMNTANTSREQAEELQQIERQWQYNRTQFEKKLLPLKNTLDQWISHATDYEKQIDEHNTQINNIQTELSQPQLPVDKGLIKPARGFIMYGPPGM
ncbi:unnamed protein product [Rotaria sp. Silwood2]|nr:unnamed protein product [Rotaria sp. Silwood2]CAF3987251.1 unnamed protein product [Rotaria sp. Silwood2]